MAVSVNSVKKFLYKFTQSKVVCCIYYKRSLSYNLSSRQYFIWFEVLGFYLLSSYFIYFIYSTHILLFTLVALQVNPMERSSLKICQDA